MTSSPGQAAACARYEQQRTPLFSLGTVLITPGALDMLEALQLAPLPFVLRHVAYFGECDRSFRRIVTGGQSDVLSAVSVT